MRISCPDTAPVRAKVQAAHRDLAAALIERDDEVDLALCALVCREHLLLVGPPGCGKTLLLDALVGWLAGRRFSILLTRFTAPEEVVGPVSLSALKEDRYRRVTTGRLPEADVCFIDEVFKASSAILNTLLKILNERLFENDGEAVPVPLRLCVAASNEWADPEHARDLAALSDRFLFRKTVRPIATAAGRQRLLWSGDHRPVMSTSITPEEVDRAHEEAVALPWSPEGKEALEVVLRELAREGVRPGDRRQFKAVAAAQAFAYLDGGERVEPEHLAVLQHVLWDSPEEQPQVAARVIAKVANPPGMRVAQLLLESEQVVAEADVANLAQAATATAKLGEIDKQLGSLKPSPRQERARQHVREQVRKIKLASIEAI